MDLSHNDLRGRLDRLAADDGGLAAAENRLLSDLPRARRGRSHRVIGAGVAGALATAGVVIALNAAGLIGGSDSSMQKHPTTNQSADEALNGYNSVDDYNGPEVVEPGEPCFDAVELDPELAAISRAVKVPITQPDAAITRAWRCGDTPVLMFDDVQVSYEEGWTGVDIERKWADLAADTGGTVESIAGHSALVQPADGDGARNQVLIVEGDILIRLLATADVPISRLTELAATLKLK